MPAKRSPKKSRRSSPPTPTPPDGASAVPALSDAALPASLRLGEVVPGGSVRPGEPGGRLDAPVLPGVAAPAASTPVESLSGLVAPGAPVPGDEPSGATPGEPNPTRPAPPKAGPPGGRGTRMKGNSQRAGQTRFYAFRRS
ncbi:hypothetical protein ACIA5A_14035 [Micromonospora sp. NPDC051300]|uniref:hypothetical protein n=1 Tax=Micromonospora sp. NPDC051300 TaxID=3364286 RepID=UPI0037977AE7